MHSLSDICKTILVNSFKFFLLKSGWKTFFSYFSSPPKISVLAYAYAGNPNFNDTVASNCQDILFLLKWKSIIF